MEKARTTMSFAAYDAPAVRISEIQARRILCASPIKGSTEEMSFGDTTGWYDGTETMENGGDLSVLF